MLFHILCCFCGKCKHWQYIKPTNRRCKTVAIAAGDRTRSFFCQSVPHSPSREHPLTQVRVLHTPFQGGVSHTNPTHKPHRADERGTLWRITGRRGERIVRGRERLFSQPRNRNRWQERLRYSLIDPYSLSLTSSVPRYRHFYWRSQAVESTYQKSIWSR